MNTDQIAYNIKYLREQNNWTQQKLADQLMVSRSTVTKWENNQLTPDVHSLIKLSDVFHVTLDNLVGNESHSDELVKEFKRIYQSKSIKFDDEAVVLVSYLMKFPELKQEIRRLSQLSLRKQQSIQKLLSNIINEYEQI